LSVAPNTGAVSTDRAGALGSAGFHWNWSGSVTCVSFGSIACAGSLDEAHRQSGDERRDDESAAARGEILEKRLEPAQNLRPFVPKIAKQIDGS